MSMRGREVRTHKFNINGTVPYVPTMVDETVSTPQKWAWFSAINTQPGISVAIKNIARKRSMAMSIPLVLSLR